MLSNQMDEKEYIEQRLDDQISWYSKKSQCNQKWYKRLKAIEIGAAVSIPFFVSYITDTTPNVKIIVGVLGLAVALISGILALHKFQEIWIEYRTTTESLKHEKFLYLTRCDPYNIENSFCLLVERVESLISKENTKWAQGDKIEKREKDG